MKAGMDYNASAVVGLAVAESTNETANSVIKFNQN